jgi:hypothetical protein
MWMRLTAMFTKGFNKKLESQETILNTGLRIAMEFGDRWLHPINDRLQKKYTYLSEQELEEYNTICQTAMTSGNRYIYDILNKLFEAGCTITNTELKEQFKISLKSHYDWINESNLSKLYSHGCYYAWKDGLDKAIVN